MNCFEIIDKIDKYGKAELCEYAFLINNISRELAAYAAEKAVAARKRIYGNKVFVRGLVEISNICKNDCFYCGIRKSNENCQRYRLSEAEILACCDEGDRLGFKTFVLQGGEDGHFSDGFLCKLIEKIKSLFNIRFINVEFGEVKC